MNEIGGWLWALLGLAGVGGLAVAIGYGVNEWRHRRKDFAMRAERDRATREIYRQES